MCPKRRTIHDSDIAATAGQLLSDAGPAAVTFAEVSKRCGLAPPTLVQRFGTHAQMMEAAVEYLARRLPDRFADAQGLLPALQETAAEYRWLNRHAASAATALYSLELRKQISYSLAGMVEAGELPHCDVGALARSIQFAFAGAVACAAMEQREVHELVELAIEGILASYT